MTPRSKTRKPKDTAPPAVMFGEHSDNVRALQTFLRDHGYANEDSEGTFANYTRNAVAMFQEANGMPMTGHWTAVDSATTGDLLAQGSVVAFEP